MRAALEARIKHNTLESAFVILKSRKQGRTLLLATFRSFRSFRSVPFRVLLIHTRDYLLCRLHSLGKGEGIKPGTEQNGTEVINAQ